MRMTLNTVTVVAGLVGFPKRKIVKRQEIYEASARDLIELIREVDDSINHLMLCGHNPGLTELANRLTVTDTDNIPTGACLSIRLATNEWASIKPGNGAIEFFIKPRDLVGPDGFAAEE